MCAFRFILPSNWDDQFRYPDLLCYARQSKWGGLGFKSRVSPQLPQTQLSELFWDFSVGTNPAGPIDLVYIAWLYTFDICLPLPCNVTTSATRSHKVQEGC